MSIDNLSDFTDFIIHEMKMAEQDPNESNKLKSLTEDNFKFILFDLFLGMNDLIAIPLCMYKCVSKPAVILILNSLTIWVAQYCTTKLCLQKGKDECFYLLLQLGQRQQEWLWPGSGTSWLHTQRCRRRHRKRLTPFLVIYILNTVNTALAPGVIAM